MIAFVSLLCGEHIERIAISTPSSPESVVAETRWVLVEDWRVWGEPCTQSAFQVHATDRSSYPGSLYTIRIVES